MRVAVIGLAAAIAGLSGFAALQWHASRAIVPIALWYEDQALVFPPSVIDRLGGPLTDREAGAVSSISRAEVQKAFTGLRLALAEGREGFWRVAVVRTLPIRGPLPNAGESLPLGPLGGQALVGADEVAANAVHYAPAGASRETLVEGIGRGIGRVAIHEFAHQIVGVAAPHNETDPLSYEYPSPARAAQYYGELRWTIWWPDLERQVGR
jgi:hypothetical protein